MKLTIKWIQKILFLWIVLVCLSSLFFSLIYNNDSSRVPSILGYKAMTVLSGSMEPSIRPGDMIVIKSAEPRLINAGDVITYRTSNNIDDEPTKYGRDILLLK